MKSFKFKENIYNILALIILLIITLNIFILVNSAGSTINLAVKGTFTILYIACVGALLFIKENRGKGNIQLLFAALITVNMLSSYFLNIMTFSVSLSGLILGLMLFLTSNLKYTVKRGLLFGYIPSITLLLVLNAMKIVTVAPTTGSVIDFTINIGMLSIFLLSTLFCFYLFYLNAQITPQSDAERTVYEKSIAIEELNDKIIRLNDKLDLNNPGRNNLKVLFNKIETQNKEIKDYLEEYKMTKRDLPLTVCTTNIDKNLDKLSNIIENHNSDEETVNSCELTLDKESMLLEVKRSKDRYEIPLKGILYKIIYHLMDKLVTDIQNKVYNYDIKGFIERDRLEEKVFGEVCGKNRLNTNITRIRSLFSQIGLDIDLIESRDSMIRLKTISDKVTIIEEAEESEKRKIG